MKNDFEFKRIYFHFYFEKSYVKCRNKRSTNKLGVGSTDVAEGNNSPREHIKIYIRDRTVTVKDGIVNLHPTEGTHWITDKNES